MTGDGGLTPGGLAAPVVPPTPGVSLGEGLPAGASTSPTTGRGGGLGETVGRRPAGGRPRFWRHPRSARRGPGSAFAVSHSCSDPTGGEVKEPPQSHRPVAQRGSGRGPLCWQKGRGGRSHLPSQRSAGLTLPHQPRPHPGRKTSVTLEDVTAGGGEGRGPGRAERASWAESRERGHQGVVRRHGACGWGGSGGRAALSASPRARAAVCCRLQIVTLGSPSSQLVPVGYRSHRLSPAVPAPLACLGLELTVPVQDPPASLCDLSKAWHRPRLSFPHARTGGHVRLGS